MHIENKLTPAVLNGILVIKGLWVSVAPAGAQLRD
jgi:hypothetical protein